MIATSATEAAAALALEAPRASRPRRRTTLGVGVVTAGVSGAVWWSTTLSPSALTHDLALFCHLACLVVGFGAVLAVDWVGLLWTLRRRSLTQVLEVAGHLHVPIWGGYAGLVVSGAFLEPDLGSPLTLLKLAMVVVVGWNGVLAARLLERLNQGDGVVTRGTRALAGGSVVVSQAGWWVATAIGYANAS